MSTYKHQLSMPMSKEYQEYLRDESRSTGYADSISFPCSEADIITITKELFAQNTAITIQGARTGLAAGAVPYGGHIMNLSRMDKVLGFNRDSDGNFLIKVQPGMILLNLNKMIAAKNFDNQNFDSDSQKIYRQFLEAEQQFFPTDPTETSATIGGMVACNASGARSYYYGSIRPYINALSLVLADGQTISLKRNQYFAKARKLILDTDQGNQITINLPKYQMPKTKNASGYYAADNMDAIDLFVGSDGSLAIITAIELKLLPLPKTIWGITCFAETEDQALDLVIKCREKVQNIVAIEFFDEHALKILIEQKSANPAFAQLPEIKPDFAAAIYFELHCDIEDDALKQSFLLADIMEEIGLNSQNTWVARNETDRHRLLFFRHAVPEAVNMLIDQRKKSDPKITKLGTDMAVANHQLKEIMAIYRSMLTENNLQSAIWGHIGDNHLHVNILPRNGAEYDLGKKIYASWANIVSTNGGAVSAEHGVGKLKASFLEIMFGPENINGMAKTKASLDNKALLGRDNMFAAKLISEIKEGN